MTLNMISHRFHISMEELSIYEENGLLSHKVLPNGTFDYTEEDISRLGFVHSLIKSGVDIDVLREYFSLSGNKEEQIRVLRKCRYKLLDDIHTKQLKLDELDYMINEMRKGE